MDMDRLDRTPPHALVVETFVRPSVEPPAARPSPRDGPSVGRAVGRSVVLVRLVLVVVVVVRVRTRRRFAPAMSATAQFSSSAITGCVSARRSASPRLARCVVSRHSIDRLDRIRARGKIRGEDGNDGIQPKARLSRSVTTKTTTRMDACIFYAFDTRRASRVPRSHRAWIGAHSFSFIRLTLAPARTPTVGSFHRVAVESMSTTRANAFSCVV